MSNTHLKKGQKAQISFEIGSKKHIMDTYIIEPDSDRLTVSFPDEKKEFMPFLCEGTEIKAFIYSYTGIIIVDSIVLDSPFNGQFVIEYNENPQIIQRRKHTRVMFNVDFFLQQEDGNIKTQTLDISGGGVRFTSEVPLTANEVFNIQLRINQYEPMIKAQGIILKKSNYRPNEYVLEFSTISERDRNRIIQKCSELEKEQRKATL